MPIISVVTCNVPDLYVWKWPSDELGTWTQLVVSESQEAVLLKDGIKVRVFGPGRYTLDTANIPILSELFKIPFGESPFKASIWFINKTFTLDVPWGTSDPIQLQDPKYGVMLPVRARGQFGVQIEDSAKFLIKIAGTRSKIDRDTLISEFKGIVLEQVKGVIAGKLVKDNISILHVNAHLKDISDAVQGGVELDFSEFGVKVVKFKIVSISTPEDDSAVKQLKAALAKKAEMNIVGYSYQQERSFDTMEGAAKNPGAPGSGLMGAGIGLGMGLGLGGAMGNATTKMTDQMQFNQPQPTATCSKCSTAIPAQTKFCPSCGFAVAQASQPQTAEQGVTCDKCGKKFPQGTKFCPDCGNKLFKTCSKCNKQFPPSGKFCPECGTELT